MSASTYTKGLAHSQTMRGVMAALLALCIVRTVEAQLAPVRPAESAAVAGNRGGARREPPGQALYLSFCASCHGADRAGARTTSLFDADLLEARTDAMLHASIAQGNALAGMPPFKGILSDEQIWQIIAYTRIEAASLRPSPEFIASPHGQLIRSQKQAFRIEVLVSGLNTPWGMAFLPDGRMLVTERSGALRIIAGGKLQSAAVQGTPVPYVRQDGGMLDVALHPEYAKNGWIYLAYTEILPGYDGPMPPPGVQGRSVFSPPSMTAIIRGRINGNNEWTDTETVFRAPAALYTSSVIHYGTRLLFDRAGHLYYALGDRGEQQHAQNLASPLGKVHRVNADGSIPKDNPFLATPDALPSVWSYGHRNPQGLHWDMSSGLLWESEHGPTGGDEINVIEKGGNYGWGVVTKGFQQGIALSTAPGMLEPAAYYTPAIAPSGIHFYTGNRYARWKHSLFVSGLAGQQLRRLEIKGRQVVAQEVIFQKFGRVRTLSTGPDGLLYVLLQFPTGGSTGMGLSAATPGMLVRLAPVR